MPKNIAVFIDGTRNDGDGPHETNVHHLWQRVLTHPAATAQFQVCHYIAGVGTDKPGRLTSPHWLKQAKLKPRPRLLHRVVANIAGGAAGYGTARRIKEAYAFLVHHFEPGDKIFLFGFSRGAFAVRSLACFVDEVGLLLKGHIADVEHAYAIYEAQGRVHPNDLKRYLRLRTGASAPDRERRTVLPIHMLGVWDTVAMLGLPAQMQVFPHSHTGYHRTTIPQYVSNVRHALALHEVRPWFEPLIWDDACRPGQTLRQVWFPGAHADVGGGYARRTLSDVALEWMACEARQLGLRVDADTTAPPVDKTFSVHHEVRGKFAWPWPRVRPFLRAVVSMAAADLTSHHLHQVATHRVLKLPGNSYPFFRFDVADRCFDVDCRTAVLAMKLAYELDRLPVSPGGACEPGRHVPFSERDHVMPTGVMSTAWRELGWGHIKLAEDDINKLKDKVDAVMHIDAARATRALVLSAVMGESGCLEAFELALSKLEATHHELSGDSDISDGQSRLQRWVDFTCLEPEVFALEWTKRIQYLHITAAVQLDALKRLALQTRADRHRHILWQNTKRHGGRFKL